MNVEALKELAANLEANNEDYFCSDDALFALRKSMPQIMTDQLISSGRCAFNLVRDIMSKGSLDAAKALHDAVLPGWAWSVKTLATDSVQVWTNRAYGLREPGFIGTTKDNAASSWLLAILRALIAENS